MLAEEVEDARGLALFRENVATVWSNRDVRRIQLAFIGSEICGWAYAMAIMVWAYNEGGAVLVGTWAGVRALLSAVLAPVGGTIADRMSRRTYMLAVNAVCIVLVAMTAAAIYFDLGLWAVLVPATVSSIVSITFRPAQAGLLPQLVDNPRQLTSANATAELVDSTAMFIGPALAGILLGVVGIVPVVLLQVLGFAWSLLLVAGVRRDDPGGRRTDGSSEDEGDDEDEGSFLTEAAGGFRTVAQDRDLLALFGLLGVNGIMAGVMNVLLVIVAAQMLGDPNTVGLLSAVLGVAAFVGGLVVLGMAGKVRLGRMVVIGVLGWCIPLAAMGFLPNIVVIVVALALIGLSDPLINVGVGTIPPRLVPDRVLSRVFSAIESMFIGTAALGAFITPFLVAWLGLGRALIVMGAVGLAITLLCAVRMPSLDARLARPRGLDHLERIELFRPLSPALRERLAQKLEPASVAAGDVIIAEGGVADRFFVIDSGEVEVSQGDQVLRTEGPGEVFGEIGLLRDVPRTATVRATTDVELLTLTREEFLDLVSSDDSVRSVAHDLATRRLIG